jgi:hypothetical protein
MSHYKVQFLFETFYFPVLFIFNEIHLTYYMEQSPLEAVTQLVKEFPFYGT